MSKFDYPRGSKPRRSLRNRFGIDYASAEFLARAPPFTNLFPPFFLKVEFASKFLSFLRRNNFKGECREFVKEQEKKNQRKKFQL